MAEQAFLLAMTAYEKNQYDIAEGKFKELIEKYPRSKNILQANLVLARIYKHNNNIENAVVVWQKLVKDFPQRNQIAEALIELANYQYFNKKNYEEGKRLIEDVLKKYPNSEFADMAHLSLAVYYRDRGSYEKAKELLDQALVKFPNGSAKNDIENVLGDMQGPILHFQVPGPNDYLVFQRFGQIFQVRVALLQLFVQPGVLLLQFVLLEGAHDGCEKVLVIPGFGDKLIYLPIIDCLDNRGSVCITAENHSNGIWIPPPDFR